MAVQLCTPHFTECLENFLATVCEMLINLLKFTVPQWRGKVIRNLYLGPGHRHDGAVAS